MTAKRKEVSTLLEEMIGRAEPGPSAPCVGRIAGKDAENRILVRYGQGKCCVARLVAPLKRHELTSPSHVGAEVLLNFDRGDANLPIIVALMADPLDDIVSMAVDEVKPQDIQLDGKTVTFDASDEIVLRCGPGSITLTRDGRIVLKGIEIVSRAKEANKIKCAHSEVN